MTKNDNSAQIYKQISEYKIGGIILSNGTPKKTAEVTNKMQSLSDVPLLIGIDGLRSDVLSKENSPFLYNLSISNFTYINYNHIVERPTISGSNWSSILTGTKVDKHNVFNNESLVIIVAFSS